MRKSIIPVLICSCLLLSLSPRAGFAHHHHHYHHGGAALAWGLTGLVLGSTLAAFTYRPPSVVYTAPPPVYRPPAYGYGYAPAIPPGYCRWERYVLDGYGRVLHDGYGQPIKEYTIASCQYPPN